jgi:membrane fusion protein (multidrug efflux system)
MAQDSTKSKTRVYIPLAIVVLIVLTGAWYWYRDYTKYITTDDAHIDADNITVGAKILGRVIKLYADEGDSVQKGMLLAELDTADMIAQKNQISAVRIQALASLRQAEIKYSSDQKSLKVLEINLDRASEDLQRAKTQSEGGVITAEQLDHITKAYETAQAQLDAAKAQLLVSKSMISSASAAVETANAQVKVIESQLNNTRLYSPADGIISKRWLLPGDVVQPSQSIFTVTLSKNLWVVTFLEETKIAEIHAGQDVRFTIDAFPKVKFYGKVFLTGSSTASVFSLIPANNASGNFTKVTQRIPVRISIDRTDNNKEVSSFNILSGMSVVVKIIKK